MDELRWAQLHDIGMGNADELERLAHEELAEAEAMERKAQSSRTAASGQPLARQPQPGDESG